MKNLGAYSHLLTLMSLAFVRVNHATILRGRGGLPPHNMSLPVLAHGNQDVGLLCREMEENGTDVEVILQGDGKRSLVFSRRVSGPDGKFVGRELVGIQTTVQCQAQLPSHGERCPTITPVPNCSSINTSGVCSCIADTAKAPSLLYQQHMVTEVAALCSAKARQNHTFRVLVFGLGGGAVPMYLRSHCDTALVESVEVDARVALVAEQLLGFRPDSGNKLEIADSMGAAHRRAVVVSAGGPRYDVALVDCFDGKGRVPETCRSDTFVTLVRSMLNPGGRVMQNVLNRDVEEVQARYQKTFGKVAVDKVPVQRGQFLVEASVPGV